MVETRTLVLVGIGTVVLVGGAAGLYYVVTRPPPAKVVGGVTEIVNEQYTEELVEEFTDFLPYFKEKAAKMSVKVVGPEKIGHFKQEWWTLDQRGKKMRNDMLAATMDYFSTANRLSLQHYRSREDADAALETLAEKFGAYNTLYYPWAYYYDATYEMRISNEKVAQLANAGFHMTSRHADYKNHH